MLTLIASSRTGTCARNIEGQANVRVFRRCDDATSRTRGAVNARARLRNHFRRPFGLRLTLRTIREGDAPRRPEYFHLRS